MLVCPSHTLYLSKSDYYIVNDLWDRDIDPLVERTKDRPIAARRVSVKEGIAVLGTQCTAGLAILLTLNNNTFQIYDLFHCI